MKVSYPKDRIQIFLIEKIHDAAREALTEAGYHVTCVPNAADGPELDEIVAEAHIIGVRSRTKLRRANLEKAKRLMAVGCFTVGTDQVDLDAATSAGVPVFNAPYSSTRSVAELAIGNLIMLARRASEKSQKMHRGLWDKGLAGAVEVRGKTVGIVGYGHIGQQVGLLAEAIGMNVIFYDILKKLPLGNARPQSSLAAVLSQADFVSLHVPGTERTKNMVGEKEMQRMKPGSVLLNLSRGNVVGLPALRAALESGHLSGAALDVFPTEPGPSEAPFECELTGIPNVILTPHIGGNTEEAQVNIGKEVAHALRSYIDTGSTEGTVNFPSMNLPPFPDSHRILNIHQNVPGVLAQINQIVSEVGANIDAQYLNTYKDIGYLIMDINKELSEEVKQRISALSISIRTRVLY